MKQRRFLAAVVQAPVVIAVLLAGEGVSAAQLRSGTSEPATRLNRFLQTFADDDNAQYVVAFTDLNGDGNPEAIVCMVANKCCGSGGCTALVLMQSGASWVLVTKITLARLPIRVLQTLSNGWRDLGVWVEEGGVKPGYEAVLHFNGKKYPGNPSMVPRAITAAGVKGHVVIASVQGAVSLRAT